MVSSLAPAQRAPLCVLNPRLSQTAPDRNSREPEIAAETRRPAGRGRCMRSRQLLRGAALARTAHASMLCAILMGLAAGAADGAPAAAGCASCHRKQALTQPVTSMGRALETVAECQILREHPQLLFREDPYSYKITREGERSVYSVTDGRATLTMPVAWAFGLGSAGQTYVYRWNDAWYESRVSFYRAIDGLDLTLGAAGRSPKTLEEAAGRRLSVRDAADCFSCHATHAIHQGKVQVDLLVPGVS